MTTTSRTYYGIWHSARVSRPILYRLSVWLFLYCRYSRYCLYRTGQYVQYCTDHTDTQILRESDTEDSTPARQASEYCTAAIV